MIKIFTYKNTISVPQLFSIFLILFISASIDTSHAQTVSITASGPTTFCDGDNVTLSALTKAAAADQNPGGGSSTGDCNCPPGYVVVGIQGRTGSWVDQYSLICQQLTSSGTLTGATVVTTPNGASAGGGAVGPFMLTTGRVMVGGTVAWHRECTNSVFGFCTNYENYLLTIGLKGQLPSFILANGNNNASPSTAPDLTGSESSNGSTTTYVPNGSVVTGMKAYSINSYSSGVTWIYTPIAQVMTDYLWSPGGQTTKSINVTTSGNYTLTATGGSTTGSASQLVTVNSVPSQPTSFTTSSTYVCKGSTYTYTVPAVTGATSYNWSYDGGSTTITGSTNSVSIKFNGNNSGTLKVSATNSCGTGTSLSMNVLLSTNTPSNTTNSLTGSSSVCQGTSGNNYTVGATTGATYYVWAYSGSNATLNGDQATTSVDFASNASSGNLTVKAANGCGVNGTVRTKAITVNSTPVQPDAFTTFNTSVCPSTTGVSYIIPATTGATSYAWSYSGSGATINGTTRSVTIDYAQNANSGTLSVAGINVNCGTGPARTISITVNPLPAISQIPTTGLLSNYRFNGNANDETMTNPGTLQNAPTASADRFGITNSAYTFNGTSQYVSTSQAYTNLGNFTLSIWFKTTSLTGGRLIGMGSSQTGLSSDYDRLLYMNNAGQLYFGVYPGGIRTISSALSYNDGNWHMATVSLSSTNGMKLYVDGALVTNDPTITTAYTYSGVGGYWKIGYDNINGWTSAPTSFWWKGSLDDILIYNTELTDTQVNTLYTSPDGAGNNGPVCVGSTLTLSATTLASTTYAWTGPSFSSSSQNPTLTYLPAAAGTYTLTATTGGCSAKAYTNVITNPVSGLWTGNSSTSWQSANNWCGGVLPSSTTNVTIPSVTNLPVNNGTADVKNITISPSASFTNSAAGIINVYGNWTNNGTYIDNGIYSSSGKVNFTGTTSQSISGATTFNNININNSNGVSLNSSATVNGILTLTSGTFATNNNLTQNLYTGGIAGTGSGATTGNIQFNKTIWGDQYHYLSAPISGLTVADWNDDVVIKFGVNSNLYTYNETLPDSNKKVGWTQVASTAVSLQSVKGYALYFPRWIYNTAVDVTGPYNHSATFSSGTLTNTKSTTPVAKPTSDGWQLLGNPYPSDLNWDATSGWTKTGLDNTIYSWDARTKRYAYYVGAAGVIPGAGTNGGTQYIGSMQGFFVKVTTSGGTGSLTIGNAARVTSTLHDVWRTASDEKILRLKIANDINEDETLVRFANEASEQFDSNLDAYKFLNDGSVPSLFSSSADAEYAINTLPTSLSAKIIPLQLNVMATGEHTWNATLSGFEGDAISLEDRLLDKVYDLSLNPTFKMTLTAGEQKGRFFIHYSKKEKLTTGNEAASSPIAGIEISAHQQDVVLLFSDRNSGTADIAVFDAVGEKIHGLENAPINGGKINFSLPNTSTGIYIVKVQTSASAKTQQVYIQK